MLQPRLFGCAFKMGSFGSFFGCACVALILSSALVSCQEINNESIEATRIKREGVSENRDLTVLLVNDQQRNDYNSRIGRYHSVKPLIGLLTSTARTFIQDGVTTEFATQILGTTLNNGRIYAQLLTKSSLVLYNKPANEDAVVVKPTRVHSAFDGQWSVKQDLGFIDPDKFVLKNTDYLAPSSKMDIIYASKPAQESNFWNPSPTAQEQDNQIAEEPTGRRVQPNNEIPRYVQNEAFNYLDGPSVESEKKLEFVVKPAILENINALHRQSKAYEPVTEPIKIDSRIKEELNESNIVKVKPNYDLPTFTIKNEFSPIFYYIDNVESRSSPQPAGQQTKLPKKLFGQKSETRPKKTFTYAGFADFTTVVGDTVIIFTPNTDIPRPQNPDEVNVFPSAKQANKMNTKITFLAADIPVATATYKAHEVNAASKVTTPSIKNISGKNVYNDEESLKKVHYEIDNKPDSISVQSNSGFDFNLDVIQPSEAAVTTTESTRLADNSDNLEVIPIHDHSQATDPLTTLRPTATIIEEPKESAVTESNISEDLVTSEEEADNTAAEVTEKVEEEEEGEEEDLTTENEMEMIITTESGHSDESYEDIETTTETKHDTGYGVICSSGLETKSTMTTAYKTLTYLTTYFIPLESSVTTTSVKSNVVVESDVGYLTNVACKSDINIEPTAVVKVNVQSSVHSSKSSEVETEESVSSPPTQSEVVTEAAPKTTPKTKESATTIQDNEDEIGTTVDNRSQEEVEKSEEKESTTNSLTTTTEQVPTSQSHVEVSVSTEHSTTPTEKPASEEVAEDSKENEIDLIYKSLYTTYTYFTTFFGDQTSSVASHKSIVTNVITSTINLANLDPSLLGAFDEDEIAPTNVGIGRPTESFAINSIIDLVKNKDVLESVEGGDSYSSQTPTPSLGDDVASIKPDAVKTYLTTYTFFTTIYVGTDANVCSRSEVYTNYVGPDELIPTKSNPLGAEKTKAQFDFRNCKQIKREPPANPEENSSMESSVSMEENNEQPKETNKDATPQPTPVEVDMLFSVESNPLDTDNSYTDTVTDVKSSSSRGERQYIENNNVLDDQISSESNIEEIMPSPTLLLQTSYTTFTYFTTMYIGKDSSKVKSRLETITNVVTETITPKREPEEESNLPITYYTTFTYWTTLYKDKTTTITSREEIVSNIVTPVVQVAPTISPIDTTPIDIESVLPPKELEVEIKPSLIENTPEQDDGKATFYTTYTYFTTFYAGNTSQIRSSLETVTNIVDNTKVVEDNQLGRKVPTGPADKNLIQDNGEKPQISPTVVKEEIKPTKLPDISAAPPTVLVGTYIDNLFAEINPANTPAPESDKKVIFSQVAVIAGDSVIVTNDNKTLSTESTTTTPVTNGTTASGTTVISPTPEVIESSVAEPDTTTEAHESEEEDEDDGSSRKKSRLTFTTKKPSFTPVIIPFASRNRPTFSPKARVSLSSATTITRADFTPTITATPTLKSVRPSGFGGNRKPSSYGGSSSAAKRFPGRSSISNPSANVPSASRSGGFGGRASIQPTSRRTGFRSSSIRGNSLDYASRSAIPRIRPTASSRLRGNRNSASVSLPPPDQNESETSGTQQEENATEALNEVTEAPVRTTNNPLLRFRRPPIARQPGTAVTPRVTTPATRRTPAPTRGRLTTTTRRPTTRSTTNPLLSLRRQRPNNSLFPRRNLFKQPEPEPEEEIKENEQEVEESDEILEGEEFEEDNDYESSNRKEQQVATPSTPAPRRNVVSIRPFSRRRLKRQVDYGSRKYTNFRRPGLKSATTKAPEAEPETEPPAPATQKPRLGSRFNSRLSSGSRTTTSSPQKASPRQPFIVRGESRTTTTSAPAYRRSSKSRSSSRTTTISSRPKAPKLLNRNSQSGRSRSPSRSSTSRSQTRTTTSRGSSRQRNSFENYSGERQNYKNIVDNGKITITHQIPTEVTIPVVNGKITEYKNVLTAKPSIEVLLRNQVATTLGPLGNQQLVLASDSTKLAENGATEVIKFYLHETPTTTVIFTPTTIRGRKTSYSHVLPSTVYNVEPVTQTIAPEINANVPLANLLLSQLLLGNQQPAINPLLALQGQGLLPQQPLLQTPVTEYKTRTTTYVTTVTDARETVLPITFKGKAILTTIVDPTTNVITATEFVTDTVVTTPTALAPQPQFNSLLLPLLLQQQQQQQQAIASPLLQTPNPLLGLGQRDLNLLQNNNLNNDIYSNSPKPNILPDLNGNEDFSDEVQDIEEDAPPPPLPVRARNKPRAPKPAPPKLTSVVTMYVSGRYPGEFSTVLSTVVVDDTQTVRKREAVYYDDIEVLPSILPSIGQLTSSQSDTVLENSIVSGTEKYLDDSTFKSQVETQSLESIVGSLSEHIRYDASPTYVVKLATTTAIRDLNLSSVDDVSSFNTNGIVYDNSPWRPGRDIDLADQPNSEDERRFKNLATKVLSNGVEVLVKDKNDAKQDQRKLKLMHVTSFKQPFHHASPSKSLLSSAVATVFSRQQMSAMFPLHQLMQHNYIIKTCMTTYTYLTTVVQNKRSDVSTFETIVSVITTESLTNLPLYATNLFADIKPTNTKYMEVKTIKPTTPSKIFQSSFVKIDKRIDNDNSNSFDLIQPSEDGHTSCTSSCSCSHTKTESLKTKYVHDASAPAKYAMKTSKYDSTKLDLRPTNKESPDKKTQYNPYEYETGSLAPTDKVVEKYTEVINDYSDEKDSNSVEESELLTNEQAPVPPKPSKAPVTKSPVKQKPDKIQKPNNKNKFVVADLLKLGSLGIKGLSQLAPVFEKMTGGFIKKQENKTITTTVKPVTKLTAYSVNKRIDTDMDSKSNFPIYIPVDELETSESQIAFTNATLHQNLAWAAEHKQPKARIVPPKMIHESPLVNGGIPISPGEIITANSDVIVGRPAVGGPLTLAASGIKLQNPVNPPPLDSFVAADEQYLVQEKPPSNEQTLLSTKVDDSFDLRPPELPKPKPKPVRNFPRPSSPPYNFHNNNPHNNSPPPKKSSRPLMSHNNDHAIKPDKVQPSTNILGNHGRPAFLDYIPSLARPESKPENSDEIPDNSPSSSEIINTRVRVEDGHPHDNNVLMSKPFLVDIQPSRVANVLIPHGSSTALVFAGSSEPHKTGDYVDDPLPYPEPGYFGSFSIDAPQMTNVHNVAPSNNQFASKLPHRPLEPYKPPHYKNHTFKNDQKIKWKDSKGNFDYNKIPPPTSNQETFLQIGPQITAYNPNIYHPNNGDFEHYSHIRGKEKPKEVIDKEYENYLAVPPPPPKMHFSHDSSYDKNKPYHQKPIVHTKPVQDMKVFLNIQHPVPKPPQKDQLPPKITSEIYFAAQMPSSKPTPVYTVHIPPAESSYGDTFQLSQIAHDSESHRDTAISSGPPPTYANKSITNNEHEKDGTYTVTLNTATNVASNVGDAGQVIGSSVPVSIGTPPKYGDLNTDIPISTNFAIRVEDDATHSETYNIQSNQNKPVVHEHVGSVINDYKESLNKVSMGDNRWNTSSIVNSEQSSKNEQNDYYYRPNTDTNLNQNGGQSPSMAPSLNSHANFPMTNDRTTPSNDYNHVKPVTELVDDIKFSDQKRPAKLIPNIPTNSHGWYSSVPLNENTYNGITNIKVESTTRNIIPLLQDFNKDPPHFGQKITSAGKPPSGFWDQENPSVLNHHGRPFTKPNDYKVSYSSQPPITSKPYSPSYIPSNFGTVKQPAYDIPIRDNSDETTTVKFVISSTQNTKPVFENSEEVYDGEEDTNNNNEPDGEVSQESMKVPVVSTSSGADHTSSTTTQLTLLQDEIISTELAPKDKNVNLVDFNPGTQTEKPFGTYNRTLFSTNTIKPIYDRNPYMNPRPFTVNTITTLDHQLHQPHWQINQMLENSTNISYEENFDLNTGEEMSTISTTKPSTTHKVPYYKHEQDNKYKRPPRPIFSARPNNTLQDSNNIITSTVQIQDKKPLVVEKLNEKTTLPSFTITTDLDINRTSSEIIDLSPPPPTIDYNFKPSTNDEMIMGMSPPPPRTPPAIRQPVRTTPRPIRTPPPYKSMPPRTLPPRTFPPRITTPRPSRKPITRDDVSTYRPAYDILNNVKRPAYNHDQPSSQLLPPPQDPSRVIQINPSPTERPTPSNIIFPTPVSSGWLTSSGIEFAPGYDFEPTSIQFPATTKSTQIPELHVSSTESNSYEEESSSERNDSFSSEKPDEKISDSSKEGTGQKSTVTSIYKRPTSTESTSKESQEDVSTEKTRFGTGGYRNRTRKPYPSRDSSSKYKTTTKPTSFTKPVRTRPEILYPTRPTPIKKIPAIRPIPHRPISVSPTSIIESSEAPVEEDFIQPTEVLKESSLPTIQELEVSNVTEKVSASLFTPSSDQSIAVKPTHHAGNEVKVFDEIIPTKTEFKTTVVTLTKTLSEPPQTISSIGYVNLTHTLTVTHTKTSLVSQSEGAVTQTLILTNTHTSTIVDVVTEVYTQVQPTTIIETVTKHIPIQLDPTPVVETTTKTKLALDDVTMSSEEADNFIIKDSETTENIQKIQTESDSENDTFFVVMNKSQNGGQVPPVQTDIETGDYDGITRNEQVNSNGVSQVLFGEILLAGTPYLETTNVGHPTGAGYGKECQPDCKASRNERCQRIDGLMKCVCRPGFARMFPDRPCKPTYTYSVKLALGTQGNERLLFHDNLADNSSKQYQALAFATHEGINRMIMQSDLRDVFHGVHITGFHPVEVRSNGELFQGVMNDFYVQLSDNAHESRLKEVIEKYLRHNNYSLGGTDVHAAGELVDKLEVNDFDECVSGQFHDCSEHSQCFNLRGTYTCSCLEGYADLSVNSQYPGRICSAEPVGCERCNYHGACYSRDDRRVLCECFQWYAGSTCHINLKVVLISLVVVGALLTVVLAACAVVACSRRPRPPPHSIVACIQSMPGLHQGAMPSKQRADRRALISERADSGDASSVQNASLPYMPAKRASKKTAMSEPPAHDPPPPPAPAVMIPRARLHPHHSDSRENISRKKSMELSSEAKLISYLESGAANANNSNDEMRRKHSMESSYSAMKERHNKQGALVSAGFKVSTTIRPDEPVADHRDDGSSVHKDMDDLRFDSLRKSYSQEDILEWTDAERRLGELTLSEARSVGGTLPASTGRAASSTRLTHQEANTMAERDLGSTFLLPHVHLYKPDLTSDVSEFDSL